MFIINASEVAALVGLNPYKEQSEAIRDCYNRNVHKLGPEEKRKAQDICNSNHEIARAFSKLEKDARATKVVKEVEELKQNFHAELENIKNKKLEKISETFENKIEILDKEFAKKISNAKTRSAKKELEEEHGAMKALVMLTRDKEVQKAEDSEKHMKKYSASVSNTNFGTRKEESVADIYKVLTGRAIHKTNKSQYLDVVEGKVKICGKFDGFNDDDVLIEIKNRMRRLFGRVVDYERVQIHVYMAMAKANTSQLVERYKEKIMIHNVEYDEDFMDGILDELREISHKYFIDESSDWISWWDSR